MAVAVHRHAVRTLSERDSHLRVLFNGKVVAVRAHHTFTGHYSDALVFPANAVHEPLTFRAVITAGSTTINLDYAIEVVK